MNEERAILQELADTAESDLKANQADGEDNGPGGWWSLRTEKAIARARAYLALAEVPVPIRDALNDPSLGGSPGLNDREGRSSVMGEASRKDAGSTSPADIRDGKLREALETPAAEQRKEE